MYSSILNSVYIFNAAYFHSLFDAKFSTNDTERKVKEEAAFVHFMDFLEEYEGKLLQFPIVLFQHVHI